MFNDSIKYVRMNRDEKSFYFVGEDGSVILIKKLHVQINHGGYEMVQIIDKHGKKWTKTVHSLVAECFVGPRPEGFVINHKDGKKLNNRAENLEYVTHQQNVQHAWKNGLTKPQTEHLKRLAEMKKGKPSKTRKFTIKQVMKIRSIYAQGGTSMKQLGNRFGTCPSEIHRLIHREIYSDAPA